MPDLSLEFDPYSLDLLQVDFLLSVNRLCKFNSSTSSSTASSVNCKQSLPVSFFIVLSFLMQCVGLHENVVKKIVFYCFNLKHYTI